MTQIRLARPGDAGAIAEVHVATWRAAYPGMLPDRVLLGLSPEREGAYWRHAIATQGRAGFVQVAEGETGGIVGYGSAGPARASGLDFAGEVYTLYVTPDHQGRGLGRALLHAMFERLRRERRNSALIWVLAANPARYFYQAMGGELVAERRERHFGALLDEAAYGWADLNAVLDRREKAGRHV